MSRGSYKFDIRSLKTRDLELRKPYSDSAVNGSSPALANVDKWKPEHDFQCQTKEKT